MSVTGVYIAKRYVPATCAVCMLPASPWQARSRSFAGSRYWMRGFHLGCALKTYYGPMMEKLYEPSPFFATFPKSKDFYGATYAIPLPRKTG